MSRTADRILKPLMLTAIRAPMLERLYVAYWKRWKVHKLTSRSHEVLAMFNRRAPAVGEPAPDFTLANLNGEAPVTFSRLYSAKPAVLIFGSYT